MTWPGPFACPDLNPALEWLVVGELKSPQRRLRISKIARAAGKGTTEPQSVAIEVFDAKGELLEVRGADLLEEPGVANAHADRAVARRSLSLLVKRGIPRSAPRSRSPRRTAIRCARAWWNRR